VVLAKAGFPRSATASPRLSNQAVQAAKASDEGVKPSGTRFVIR